ncbi:BZ3500_MvSof-1268-A1-R1_Chr3-1g06142 [Microbotryum saponariae]|uniref:BZ3500_MvSof-1268-A1-R1_Chr3-1g06142 protein n=1 Tax=Microbotryum saponariae TaxID=289078 RepID=A0A2X0M4G2_9BASI|nr:BZ3500_MvSof-1268-A1-R1_Chr3-1g06142 [Microbotryum saponariae]SDA04005.1 BZ3501_MvSof-1269-A2-R1_Chr3-2g05827 [Microbotryum saponariae]
MDDVYKAESMWQNEAAPQPRTTFETRARFEPQHQDIEQGMPSYPYEPVSMYEPSQEATYASMSEPTFADHDDFLRAPAAAPNCALSGATSSPSPPQPWTEDEDFNLIYAILIHGETNWERVMSEQAADIGNPAQGHTEGEFPIKYLPALRERRSTEEAMSRWTTYWSSRIIEIEGHNYRFSDLFARSQEVTGDGLNHLYRDVDMYIPYRPSGSSLISSSPASLAPISAFSSGSGDSGARPGFAPPFRARSKSLGTTDSINVPLTLAQGSASLSTSSANSTPVLVPASPRRRTALGPLREGARERRQGLGRHSPLSSSPLKQIICGYDEENPASSTKGEEENQPAICG